MFAQGLFRVSFYKLPSNLRLNPNIMTSWPVICFQFAEPTWFDELHAGRTVTKTRIFSKPVAVLLCVSNHKCYGSQNIFSERSPEIRFPEGLHNHHHAWVTLNKMGINIWIQQIEETLSGLPLNECPYLYLFMLLTLPFAYFRTIQNFEHLFKSRLHHKGTWNVSWPLAAASWLSFFIKP